MGISGKLHSLTPWYIGSRITMPCSMPRETSMGLQPTVSNNNHCKNTKISCPCTRKEIIVILENTSIANFSRYWHLYPEILGRVQEEI